MEDVFDFAKEIRIDVNQLDVEWLKQPQLFLIVAEAAADAKLEADRLKELVDVIECDLIREARQDPEKFGITVQSRGITEGQVHAALKTHPQYRGAKDEYLRAVHTLDRLNAVVRAFDQRRAALERLVVLHGQSYFAGPKEPRKLDVTEIDKWKAQLTNTRQQEAREQYAGPRRRRRQEQEN